NPGAGTHRPRRGARPRRRGVADEGAEARREGVARRAGASRRMTVDELTREELLEAPVEREQRVTALELFFDLVFVFAITQVTAFVYSDPTWLRLLEALALLAVLWIAWSGYVWLGNTAASDEGAIRVVLLGAMGPLLIASLAVPNAFGKDALAFGA